MFEDFAWRSNGRRIALLGPNGAGKSTLLSLIAGLSIPQSGSVSIDGLSVRAGRRSYQERVAILPQTVPTVPGLTVREQILFAGWLRKQDARLTKDRLELLIASLELEGFINQPATKLSGGQLRRLGLAMSLISEVSVLLLDEPTAGLDPVQRVNFRTATSTIPDSCTLVVSTHQTEDIAANYDEVVVLSRGRILFDGPVEQFLKLGGDITEPAAAAEAAYVRLIGSAS